MQFLRITSSSDSLPKPDRELHTSNSIPIRARACRLATGQAQDSHDACAVHQCPINFRAFQTRGAIAQLGERLHGMQEVGGSIPPGSTTFSATGPREPQDRFTASPSSRGLGHYPFTVATGVRIPVGTPLSKHEGPGNRALAVSAPRQRSGRRDGDPDSATNLRSVRVFLHPDAASADCAGCGGARCWRHGNGHPRCPGGCHGTCVDCGRAR